MRQYTSKFAVNNHLHVMEVKTAVLLWTICYFLTQTCSTWSQQTATTGDTEDASPSLIFTTQFGVHRRRLSGGETEDLVVGSHGYGPLDYHYQKDLLFWVNTAFHRIMEAKLSNGSSIRVLVNDLQLTPDPVDLAVDWINDKLYWIDATQCEIWEYDMELNTTRYVMSTGTADTNLPRAITIYPYLNNGWLYWTDRLSGSVMMGSVHGGELEVLIDDLLCVESLTLDYTTHTLYWADMCEYTFQCLNMNGNRETHTYPFNQIVFFVSSIAKFGDDLYWVEPNGIHAMSRSGDNYRRVMEAGSSERPLGLQIVHSSHQPQVEEYIEIIMNTTEYECDPVCLPELGTCIPPGLCACKKGWKGPVCGDDIDECAEGTAGCQQICTNSEGGYNCSCYSGYAINVDLKTCHKSVSSPNVQYTVTAGPNTTAHIQPTWTSLPSAVKPSQTSLHTTFLVSSTVQPVTSLSNSPPLSRSTLTTPSIATLTPFFTSSLAPTLSTLTTPGVITITPQFASSLLSHGTVTTLSVTATSYTTTVVQSSTVLTATSSTPVPLPYSSFVFSLVASVISSPAMKISSTPTSEIIIRTPIVSELIKSTSTSTESPVTSAMPQYTPAQNSVTAVESITPTLSGSITSTLSGYQVSSDGVSSYLASLSLAKMQPSSTMVTTLFSTEGVLESTTSKTMVIRTTSTTFSDSLRASLQQTSTHQLTPTLDVPNVSNDLKWYEEYQAAIIITAVGILPALIAITLLVVILVYRSRSQSGSWSPDNEIAEQPQVEDDNVAMASFRSLHSPE